MKLIRLEQIFILMTFIIASLMQSSVPPIQMFVCMMIVLIFLNITGKDK
jgi:hypothetical protein